MEIEEGVEYWLSFFLGLQKVWVLTVQVSFANRLVKNTSWF